MFRVKELIDAVTLPILQRHTMRDNTMQQLVEGTKQGKLKKGLGDSRYKEYFQELSIQKGEHDQAAQTVLLVAEIHHGHK